MGGTPRNKVAGGFIVRDGFATKPKHTCNKPLAANVRFDIGTLWRCEDCKTVWIWESTMYGYRWQRAGFWTSVKYRNT